LTLAVGTQGPMTSAKKCLNLPHLSRHPQKTKSKNANFLKSKLELPHLWRVWTALWLNCQLSSWIGELWNCKVARK